MLDTEGRYVVGGTRQSLKVVGRLDTHSKSRKMDDAL